MEARLQFEGMGCFTTKQDAVIRPLTLLVGENGSGKSILPLGRICTDIRVLLTSASFNEPPFLLGAYDDIACAEAKA